MDVRVDVHARDFCVHMAAILVSTWPRDPYITHSVGIDDIHDAFELMHRGESIRTVALFE